MIRPAPPHPRGSTPRRHPAGAISRGSPAPAGIDPFRKRGRGSARWLPRTRGDRPLAKPSTSRPSGAPPHPRGSTPAATQFRHDSRGSPAPAGIDPRRGCPASRCSRLPRTRGDRPEMRGASFPTVAAPPHPRGSTHRHHDHARRGRGSPAPAGIDPGWTICRTPTVWLPRTRGDRPQSAIVDQLQNRAPPHPRGSTRVSDCQLFQAGGSPAPAGIDPGP